MGVIIKLPATGILISLLILLVLIFHRMLIYWKSLLPPILNFKRQ